MPHNVVDMMFDAGRRFPNRTALRRGSRTYTHAEVSRRVSTIAANLQDRGVGVGDLFLFSVTPNPEGILLALGIIASGGAIMLNDPGTSTDTLDARIEDHPPQYAVSDSSLYTSSNRLVSAFSRRSEISIPSYGRLPVTHFYVGKRRFGVPVSAIGVEKLQSENSSDLVPADAYAKAFVTFTPGDPLRAKTVVHTRASVGAALTGYAALCDIDETSRVYTKHFMFGAAAMTAGGEWEIPEHSPIEHMRKWISPLYGDRATHVFLSAEEVAPVAEEIESRAPRPLRLKVIAMNANPENIPSVRRIRAASPHLTVCSVQGMTEVLPYAHTDGAGKIAYSNGDLVGGVILGATAHIDSRQSAKMDEFVLNGDALMLGRLGNASATTR
jgi:acyl-coenzyme A synthetase/AMP-(fatty) acid ligase